MSYCRWPIYIIQTVDSEIHCFDVSEPDEDCDHHNGFWSAPYESEEQVYRHMAWHMRKFEEEKKFNEYHVLEDAIIEALTTPYYTRWYHRLDPWRWLYWRRYERAERIICETIQKVIAGEAG